MSFKSYWQKTIFLIHQKLIYCKSNNLIYLLTCENRGLQCVGETALALNKRMNIHRSSKEECKDIISHFKECHESWFFMQVFRILDGSQYGDKDRELNSYSNKKLGQGRIFV